MGWANLDLVRSIRAAWERGEFTRTDWADIGVEFVTAHGSIPGKWRGLTGMAAIAREALDAREDSRITAREYLELDGTTVLVLDTRVGRGKTSGLELPQIQSQGAHRFRIRDSKVVELIDHWDRERAFADLGLAPRTG